MSSTKPHFPESQSLQCVPARTDGKGGFRIVRYVDGSVAEFVRGLTSREVGQALIHQAEYHVAVATTAAGPSFSDPRVATAWKVVRQAEEFGIPRTQFVPMFVEFANESRTPPTWINHEFDEAGRGYASIQVRQDAQSKEFAILGWRQSVKSPPELPPLLAGIQTRELAEEILLRWSAQYVSHNWKIDKPDPLALLAIQTEFVEDKGIERIELIDRRKPGEILDADWENRHVAEQYVVLSQISQMGWDIHRFEGEASKLAAAMVVPHREMAVSTELRGSLE